MQSFLKSSLNAAGKIRPFIVIKIVLTFLLPHSKTEGEEFCNVQKVIIVIGTPCFQQACLGLAGNVLFFWEIVPDYLN